MAVRLGQARAKPADVESRAEGVRLGGWSCASAPAKSAINRSKLARSAHAWYAARRGRGPNDGGSGRTRGPSVAVFVGVGSQVHGAGAQLVAGPQPGAAQVAPLVGIPPDWAWPAEISVLLLRGPPWQDGAVFIRVNGYVLLDLGCGGAY